MIETHDRKNGCRRVTFELNIGTPHEPPELPLTGELLGLLADIFHCEYTAEIIKGLSQFFQWKDEGKKPSKMLKNACYTMTVNVPDLCSKFPDFTCLSFPLDYKLLEGKHLE